MFTSFNLSSLLPFGNNSVSEMVTEKIDKIELDVADIELTMIPENRKDVEAVLNGQGKVKVRRDGNTIKVDYERNWFELFPFARSAELNVYLPEDFKKDLSIELGSGTLNLSGESVENPLEFNELDIDIGSGHVNLSHLSVNEFSQDVSSGSVQIDSLISKESSIDISSGFVKMVGFNGALSTDVSSGKLDVQMDELTGAIEMDVSSGSVLLDLPNNADFTLNGTMSSGNISNEFTLSNQKQGEEEIQGVHGSGKHAIEVVVSSGHVKIY